MLRRSPTAIGKNASEKTSLHGFVQTIVRILCRLKLIECLVLSGLKRSHDIFWVLRFGNEDICHRLIGAIEG